MAGPVDVTFPDGTVYTSGGPADGKKHMDDGGYDPHFMELLNQFLSHLNVTIQSVGGLGAAVGYGFSTDTADEDPGDGTLRLNGASNVATRIYADLASSDGQDVAALLDALDDADNPTKGFVAVRQADDSSKWAIYRLTAVEAAAGYRKLTVVALAPASAVAFADGAPLQLSFSQAGDQGAPGNDGADGGITGGTWTGTMDADGNDLDNVGTLTVATALITALGAALDAGGFSITNLWHIAQASNSGLIANLQQLKVAVGDQWGVLSAGTVTTAQAPGETVAPILRYTLGANVTFTFQSPTANYVYWKQLVLTQDGSGARVPTFAGPGGYTVQWPLDDEQDWASQAAGTVTIVIARVGLIESTIDLFVGD